MIFIGDIICRRFYQFESVFHRFAVVFSVGFLLSTWLTYLFALIFAGTSQPLWWGNLLFFIVACLIIFFDYRRDSDEPNTNEYSRPVNSRDYFWNALFFVVSCVLMFGSFTISDHKLRFSGVVWNDFGTHISLIQSFAVGHNFPTEYPFFIGEPIRYHFLFWFQAGNLTYLGLPMDWALNLLSVFSMTAMFIMIMTLGEVLFNSRVIGRLAAILFFFHGSLSAIPFLLSAESVGGAIDLVLKNRDWVKSIYPYSGEQWGVWAVGTFYTQRHLTIVIAVFLMALIFVVKKLQTASVSAAKIPASNNNETEEFALENLSDENIENESKTGEATEIIQPETGNSSIYGFLLTGILLGLLPMWNSAIYLSAVAVFAMILVLFPRKYKSLLALLLPATVLAIPQILFLRAGAGRPLVELFRWGYVVDPPTFENFIGYFVFTFGLKTAIAILAIVFLSGIKRKFFIAGLILPILAFSTQLSADMMNNHKFLTIWVILLNFFVAFALYQLYKTAIFGKILAICLFTIISLGGTIEFFRIYNDDRVDLPFGNDAVYQWLYSQTKPQDIFLSGMYSHHPILFSGRRIFYGWGYFGWSMGYNTGERDKIWKQMYQEKNRGALLELLREHNIKYVAFDNAMRDGEMKETLNEDVVAANFVKVFDDLKNECDGLAIYQVPPK